MPLKGLKLYIILSEALRKCMGGACGTVRGEPKLGSSAQPSMAGRRSHTEQGVRYVRSRSFAALIDHEPVPENSLCCDSEQRHTQSACVSVCYGPTGRVCPLSRFSVLPRPCVQGAPTSSTSSTTACPTSSKILVASRTALQVDGTSRALSLSRGRALHN
jgi:hypothetical protein